MCKRVENSDGVCVVTSCEHHILYDELYLKRPNMEAPLVWGLRGCMKNMVLVADAELEVTLEGVAQAWGMTREAIRQLEVKAIRHFKENYKSMLKEETFVLLISEGKQIIQTKEETQDGKDSTERPRDIRVTRTRRLPVSWQTGGVQTTAGSDSGMVVPGVV